MSGGRIELDPEGLRRLATEMRGAAGMLSITGRAVTRRSLPAMPPQVSALVTEVVMRANSALQDLAIELDTEARALVARATWAELGGGDVAWLLPGLYRFRSERGAPLTADAVLSPITDDETMRSERWAIEELDNMRDSSDLSTQEVARLGAELEDAPSAVLLEFADGYADEASVDPPEGLTAAASIDFETYDHPGGDPIDGAGSLDGGSAGGALEASLTHAIEGGAALGLAGCLVAGTGTGHRFVEGPG